MQRVNPKDLTGECVYCGETIMFNTGMNVGTDIPHTKTCTNPFTWNPKTKEIHAPDGIFKAKP